MQPNDHCINHTSMYFNEYFNNCNFMMSSFVQQMEAVLLLSRPAKSNAKNVAESLSLSASKPRPSS